MTETWLDDLDWLLLLAVLFVVLVEWHSMSDKTTQTTGWTAADYADPGNQNRQITSRLNPGNEKPRTEAGHGVG